MNKFEQLYAKIDEMNTNLSNKKAKHLSETVKLQIKESKLQKEVEAEYDNGNYNAKVIDELAIVTNQLEILNSVKFDTFKKSDMLELIELAKELKPVIQEIQNDHDARLNEAIDEVFKAQENLKKVRMESVPTIPIDALWIMLEPTFCKEFPEFVETQVPIRTKRNFEKLIRG